METKLSIQASELTAQTTVKDIHRRLEMIGSPSSGTYHKSNPDEKIQDALLKECFLHYQIWRAVGDKVVEPYGCIVTPEGKVTIVMEKFGTNAYEYLKHHPEHIHHVVEKTTEIIEELHSSNIIHRDLHLKNVMVNEQGIVKLIDFGNAQIGNYSLIAVNESYPINGHASHDTTIFFRSVGGLLGQIDITRVWGFLDRYDIIMRAYERECHDNAMCGRINIPEFKTDQPFLKAIARMGPYLDYKLAIYDFKTMYPDIILSKLDIHST